MGFAAGEQLQVRKTAEPTDISVGDEVIIKLEFTNPFDKEVNIKIEDTNTFAGNGLDIQCLERKLPSDRFITLEYEPIVAYTAGNYSLAPAKITYTNPETGKEEEVASNELEIRVKENKSFHNPKQSSITTVYQCGGMSMRSTSYSSSSSMQQQQPTQQQQNIQQRVNEMQQKNQDMNSLKQHMEQQLRQQKETQEKMKEMIEKNKNFQQMQRNLEEQGYKFQQKEVNPESNGTGDFSYSYKKGNETARIRGRMEGGEMKRLEKHTSEELKEMQEKLEQNPEFQRMQNMLQEEGYSLKEGNLSPIQNNISRFNYQYLNPENQSANITGEIHVDGNITRIRVAREKKESNKLNPLWIPPLVVLLILLYFLIKRRRKRKPAPESPKKEKPIDFRKLALSMISEAEELYRKGKRKKAYTRVSEAIRLYFRYALKQKEELTDYEVVQLLKKKKHGKLGTTKECLNLCNLVKFAKYKPRDEDFDRIVKMAEEIVK